MSILDLPTEILSHILLYNVLPHTFLVCTDLYDVESSLMLERKKIIDSRYKTVESMLENQACIYFYLRYYPEYMKNEENHLRLGDILNCMKGIRSNLMKKVLRRYLPTLTERELFWSAARLSYTDVSTEKERRELTGPDGYIVCIVSAIKGRNTDFIRKVPSAHEYVQLIIFGIQLLGSDYEYIVKHLRSYLRTEDYVDIIKKLPNPDAITHTISTVVSTRKMSEIRRMYEDSE